MIWKGVWGLDSGIFHQFYAFTSSCTVLYGVDLFHTCWLVAWANSSFCVACEYISILRLWSTVYQPPPSVSPPPGHTKLFTLSTASYEWESAKCAELFSCPTVNTGQLWPWAWKETEGENGSEWLSAQIWAGWQDLYLKFTLSLSQIPPNIWMLCFQLKALAGV